MQGLIRYMELKDLPRVLDIERDSFSSPWSEKSFSSELDNPISHLRVLETEAGIIGMIAYWMVLDEVHLLTLAVDPVHRGQGYARFLLHAMLAHAKESGSKEVVLEVRENNERAIRLYTRSGFVPVGRIANYYPEDGQDALIMRKELEWTNR